MSAALVIGLAMASAFPVDSAVAAQVSPDAESRALAREMLQITYPAAKARRDSLRAFETQFRSSFGGSPAGKRAEAQFPGVTAAMVAAGQDELGRILSEIEPALLDRVAGQLATTLSKSDLQAQLAFYRSPAGKALASLDPSSMNLATGLVRIDSLSEGDRIAIGRFQSSPEGRRGVAAFQSVLSQIPQISAEMLGPRQARVSARLEAAAKSFVNGKQAR